MPYYSCKNENCTNYMVEIFLHEIYPSGRIADYEKTTCQICEKEMSKHIKEVVGTQLKGPYVKRKNWLNEWKLVNVGKTADDVKLKPNFKEQ